MKLGEIFKFHHAKSKGLEDYDVGEIAFVTNGFRNNGIVGCVTPNTSDKVFNFEGICISAFCEATVQKPPFLPRGNGGSGLLVLEPKNKMGFEQLLQIASYINRVHSWRFSYGRMVNEQRVRDLEIEIPSIKTKKDINSLLPKRISKTKHIVPPIKFKLFNVTDLFELNRGHFHALDRLDFGNTPTVSRAVDDNGVVGFYRVPKKAEIFKKKTITVATTSGDAFVQLDDFIATDNVVVLTPKLDFNIEELFFLAMAINNEKWRISYGRQCYKTIFAKTKLVLPVKQNGELDHNYMTLIVDNSYNFMQIKQYLMKN